MKVSEVRVEPPTIGIAAVTPNHYTTSRTVNMRFPNMEFKKKIFFFIHSEVTYPFIVAKDFEVLFNNFASFARFGCFKTRFGFFRKGCLATLRLPTFLFPKAKIALRLPK